MRFKKIGKKKVKEKTPKRILIREFNNANEKIQTIEVCSMKDTLTRK